MQNLMTLIQISGNKITIVNYNSNSGTITNPMVNISPSPHSRTYRRSDVITQVINTPIKGAIDLTVRTVEILDKYNRFPIASVNTTTLDSNSTSYSSDMDTYYNSITTLIMT